MEGEAPIETPSQAAEPPMANPEEPVSSDGAAPLESIAAPISAPSPSLIELPPLEAGETADHLEKDTDIPDPVPPPPPKPPSPTSAPDKPTSSENDDAAGKDLPVHFESPVENDLTITKVELKDKPLDGDSAPFDETEEKNENNDDNDNNKEEEELLPPLPPRPPPQEVAKEVLLPEQLAPAEKTEEVPPQPPEPADAEAPLLPPLPPEEDFGDGLLSDEGNEPTADSNAVASKQSESSGHARPTRRMSSGPGPVEHKLMNSLTGGPGKSDLMKTAQSIPGVTAKPSASIENLEQDRAEATQRASSIYFKCVCDERPEIDDGLLEEIDRAKELMETLDVWDVYDETLKRWLETRIGYAQRVLKKREDAYDDSKTKMLVGTQGFDGLVFDESLRQPSAVQELLLKKADPNGRSDQLGFTPAHCMAYSATLNTCFPESWHLDRLRALRKWGADNRCQVDHYGRTPLLLGLERSNVQFVKSMLRVEMGETWALHQLKNVPLFTPGGLLIKLMLQTQEELASGGTTDKEKPKVQGGRLARLRSRGVQNVDFKVLLKRGIVRPIFRWKKHIMTGIHWAAFQNNAEPIYLLAELGVHATTCRGRDTEVMLDTPLHAAAAEGNVEAVKALLMTNADINKCNANGLLPMEMLCQFEGEGYDAVKSLLQEAPYPPFKRKREGYGPEIGWDSVGHLANLYEANKIKANSVEELCNWYQDLAIEPHDRVAAFWVLRPDASFLPKGKK